MEVDGFILAPFYLRVTVQIKHKRNGIPKTTWLGIIDCGGRNLTPLRSKIRIWEKDLLFCSN